MSGIRLCRFLSRKFFEQLRFCPVLLYLCMQLVHIVCHRQKQYLGEYLLFSA